MTLRAAVHARAVTVAFGATERGGHGYGNLSQRLEALARTIVAPSPIAVVVDAPAQAAPSTAPLPTAGVVAGPDAPNAAAAPAADGQVNPLLAAFSKLFNLETAVAGSAKRQKASIGAALRQIAGTAEQFQMGDRRPTGIFRRNSNLASFGAANCRF